MEEVKKLLENCLKILNKEYKKGNVNDMYNIIYAEEKIGEALELLNTK